MSAINVTKLFQLQVPLTHIKEFTQVKFVRKNTFVIQVGLNIALKVKIISINSFVIRDKNCLKNYFCLIFQVKNPSSAFTAGKASLQAQTCIITK